MKKKYIVIALKNEEFMIDFPDSPMMFHSEMAEVVRRIKVNPRGNWDRKFIDSEIVSAGFISSDGICSGKSESLGIKSRGYIDTAIHLNGNHRYLSDKDTP